MTPVPGPQTKRAYTDPRDTVVITHLVIAASLMQQHELLGVVHHEYRPRFIFPKSASADAEHIRRNIDELTAYRERAATRGRPNLPTGANDHEQQRTQQ